jgi:hypothetical protein
MSDGLLPNAERFVGAFLWALFEPDDVIELRPLPSADEATWFVATDVDTLIARALHLNVAGENVFIGVNPRLDFGRRGNTGVQVVRTIWVDFDGRHLAATDKASQVAEALARVAKVGLPTPTIVNFSGHGVHLYWRFLEPVTDFDRWNALIDGLVTTLNSCTGAKGLDRIMRLPEFMNHKPPATRAELISIEPEGRYSWEQIAGPVRKAVPPPAPPPDDIVTAISTHVGRVDMAGRTSVIDAYNDAVPIGAALDAAGYDVAGRQFRRPGKTDRGFSGIIRPNKQGRLVSAHWSTNDVLNSQRFGNGSCDIHDAFDVFTHFEHGGDVGGAVKAAAAMLHISLWKAKSDLAVLQAITASADADGFGEAFFAPQTAETRTAMRKVLARYTTWPAQVDRILQLANGNTPAAAVTP